MNNRVRYLLVLTGFLTTHFICWSQNDTIPSPIKGKPVTGERVTDTLPPHDNIRRNGHKTSPYKVDSLARKEHDPRKATLYSTFLPGLGQIYNHKYWKLPLVYAAVGIPVYTYFYNRGWYRKCQDAISIIDTYEANMQPIPPDVLNKIDPKLRQFVVDGDDNSVRTYRNEFRKDQDYSVVFFMLFWALNIVDATVDAHLKGFDISDELSMHVRQPSPGLMAPSMGSFSGAAGISLVFDLHKARYKALPVP